MEPATIAALERVIAAGLRNVLVTGRQVDDLRRIQPRLDLFACVVAENGALLYEPATQRERLLTVPPSAALVAALARRGVTPLSVGRTIIATRQPHETTVTDLIRELDLPLQVIFNRGAVMVLPSGVDKATGLAAALASMSLAAEDAIGVGDAENDQSFLALCGCAVAVANALPGLKQVAHIVTIGSEGAGVVELVTALLDGDRLSPDRFRLRP